MTKITEAHIQAVLMRYVITELNHKFVVPNTVDFFGWEADLVSVTRSFLTHEFEVKLNLSDFKADAKKKKHFYIPGEYKSPAYFWYVTYQFEINPPEKSGWILIKNTVDNGFDLVVKKKAPRLNTWKIDENKIKQIARLLSWKIYRVFEKTYLNF